MYVMMLSSDVGSSWKDLVIACHTLPLEKAKKQAEMSLPSPPIHHKS